MKPTILLMLVLLAVSIVVVPAVSATSVEYPEEYSDLKTASYEVAFPVWGFDKYSEFTDNKYGGCDAGATRMGVANWLELRRQSILLEKQNELLAEQNRAAWVEACYAPHTAMGLMYSGNFTGLKQECQKAGYPM